MPYSATSRIGEPIFTSVSACHESGGYKWISRIWKWRGVGIRRCGHGLRKAFSARRL